MNLVHWLALLFFLQNTQCACDHAAPATLQERQCALCREAEKQPADFEIFFLQDINPRKKNRTLALPRKPHGAGMHHFSGLSRKERVALWTEAIKKAKALWGDDWGIALNAENVRTQCHLHVHIGKLLKGLAPGKVMIVDGPAQIPDPKGRGLWMHPAGKRLMIHYDETICETALMR